ncbi:hypothetical protein BpHYR1_013784 [Brachionus plicatilis]|uniref:Uncharacterized protein n=1 Tax=Brachionus plicatilis TaxID=10195 RepID=A0A3M7RAI1_BRAPC|nr:hypothetical protein BpHYR1_013784 [Brachionus plicatilis]
MDGYGLADPGFGLSFNQILLFVSLHLQLLFQKDMEFMKSLRDNYTLFFSLLLDEVSFST